MNLSANVCVSRPFTENNSAMFGRKKRQKVIEELQKEIDQSIREKWTIQTANCNLPL